ncbi:MAG: hypothetical protein NC299_11380 [Lachnospiraceae bacterium]|nr:hypothetical protein [Ruminococcus sp.]MCM1275947.1 hypothetical protein [Lachnospiraceae bacterium]
MAVLYNVEPFTAMKILYQGETDGFPEEDFARNEKERSIVLPRVLKRFLAEYGYMTVNRLSDSVRILHPNIMTRRVFQYGENRELPLLIIGRVGMFQVAIPDERAEDPEIFLLRQSPEQTQILPSDDTVSEILKVMVCGVLLKSDGAVIADDPGLAVRLLKENNVDLMKITFDPRLRREYSICFTEELRTFTAAEFVEGEMARFFFLRSEKFEKIPN